MKNKFNIGDKVKVREDLVEGRFYGDIPLLAGYMSSFKGHIFTVDKIEDRCYHGGENPFYWSEEMLVMYNGDKVIFNGNATVLIKDGKKYVSKCKDGDAYDKEKGLLLCLAKANGISYRDLQEMIAGAKDCNAENADDKAQVREVKREAKAGEYIKIVNVYGGDSYKIGDIFKVKECTAFDGDVRVYCDGKGNTGMQGHHYIEDDEYVVLENYKPYKITLSEFFNTKGKYAVRLRTVEDCEKFIKASQKRGVFTNYDEDHPIYRAARKGGYKCVGYGFVWREGYDNESFYADEGAIILNVDEVDLEN